MSRIPDRMQALVMEATGAPLKLTQVATPGLAKGQVRVKVAASGLNPLDLKIRAGAAAHARQPAPAILGIDLAGVVVDVSPDVTGFKPGDEVFGMTGGVGGHQGSLAEYAAVDAALLANKPANLSMRDAAALPLVFITAWEGLVDRANVRAGQKVLVHGGAGGVGHVAVQLARAYGAEVFATGSAKSRSYVEGLGATFIERGTAVETYVADRTAGRGFDLIYDTVGGVVLDASFAAVARFGHVVSALGWGAHALAPLSFRAGTYSGVFTLLPLLSGEGRPHHGEILRKATELIEAGKIKPRLDPRHFGFETVEQAYATVESGAAGKIVVEVGG